jgi:polyphosphate kinase 2 (PPK2 family)
VVLETLDLTQALTPAQYARRKRRLQASLHELGFLVYQQKRPCVIAFEGSDAAGKGGAIKRLTEHLDPRGYVVHPIAKPAGDDATHHYLWRFWRRLPEAGMIALFDRSWYGRVLVERVEGYATEDEWRRAYQEINRFERQLTDFGTIVVKFWLQVSKDEQLARFKARERVDYKAWKLTDEDWRNRGKWEDYQAAAEDMLLKTSTPRAPWTVVEANDKPFARIKVMETVHDVLRRQLS